LIRRFCLYGFLKNQKYYEPFLIIAFISYGMNFALIGTLIAFRELAVNLLEIPSGAIADVFGRRKSMISSFVAYIIFLILMACGQQVWLLFIAMFFYAIGDAFRTGTHKAIIFSWLEHEGRSAEKTEVYGLTRSWSKLGSAASIPIAVIVLFFSAPNNYSFIFLLAIIPYLINIINFIKYPAYLDGNIRHEQSLLEVCKVTWRTLKYIVTFVPLRRLMLHAMSFEGLFKVTESYLQPLIKVMVLTLPILLYCNDQQRTAVMIGVVYFVLYLSSSFASRRAGKFVKTLGGGVATAKCLWMLYIFSFMLIIFGVIIGYNLLVVGAFIILAIVQNLWRPMLVSRCAEVADPKEFATVLSVESQLKAIFTVIAAPLLGLWVDSLNQTIPQWQFLPVGIIGVVLSLIMLSWLTLSRRHKKIG
jgi:MFS family permease